MLPDFPIPYVLYSVPHRPYCLECGTARRERIFFALCLIDHYVVGSGPTREEALQSLEQRYWRKYPPRRGDDPDAPDDDRAEPFWPQWRIV